MKILGSGLIIYRCCYCTLVMSICTYKTNWSKRSACNVEVTNNFGSSIVWDNNFGWSTNLRVNFLWVPKWKGVCALLESEDPLWRRNIQWSSNINFFIIKQVFLCFCFFPYTFCFIQLSFRLTTTFQQWW